MTEAVKPRGLAARIGAAAGPQPLAGLDPLVVALAQLVRDRWAAEQGQPQKRVAFVRHPMNMAVVTTHRQPPLESSA